MNKLRIGIAGLGQISVASHLPAILGNSGCVIGAIIEPRVEAAHRVMSRFSVEAPIFANHLDALSHCDALVIATPNNLHAAAAIDCLESGIHVLIEKPLATSVEDGRRVVELAKKKGLVAAVGYVTRFRPNVILLKRLLDDGRFGQVRRFYHQYGTVGGWAPDSAYILDRRQSGGGVLTVTGTHFLDRMIHFWGMPDRLSYRDDASNGPEAHCELEVDYRPSGGPVGLARYSKVFPLRGRLVLDTEAGKVILDDFDASDIVLVDGNTGLMNVIRDPASDFRSNFYLQFSDFVDAIRSGRQPLVDAEQGLKSLELIHWAYSARENFVQEWQP